MKFQLNFFYTFIPIRASIRGQPGHILHYSIFILNVKQGIAFLKLYSRQVHRKGKQTVMTDKVINISYIEFSQPST